MRSVVWLLGLMFTEIQGYDLGEDGTHFILAVLAFTVVLDIWKKK